MSKRVQLKVTNPCSESWADMQPEEKGRFCERCRKCVIDFTNMSDQEMAASLRQAEGEVCGRFYGDQLGRRLSAAPAGTSRRVSFWHLLLAGLLVGAEASAQSTDVRQSVVNVTQEKDGRKVMGKVAYRGAPALKDSAADSVKVKTLPTVTVVGYPKVICREIVAGAVSRIEPQTISSKIKDTLAKVGLAQKALTVFPNPVERGTAVTLAIRADHQGSYMAQLYNSAGVLIETLAIEGDSPTALMNIPPTLAAGVYFVKLSHGSFSKVYTTAIVVR